ncbi:hypothetical protein EN850_32130 [Mesorhizobium sp. M8A.F.Ca.ET.207.01.1.1]|nr:hypothetical protein EN850_32130 [Mesorhizobium sp. M8A.F.Ca.ET.207.01.1.1]
MRRRRLPWIIYSLSRCCHHAFVILGRSKERSDAAQTLGSMPRQRPKNTAVQNERNCLRVDTRSSDSISPSHLLRGHGMDPRVSATSLRDCSTLG